MKTDFQRKDAKTQRRKEEYICISFGLALCLLFATGGCKPKMREGEMFLVLKSDEVKPLADVEVIGFDNSFGPRLVDWQRRWNIELLSQKSAQWQDKLESLNRQIRNTLSQTNKLEFQARDNLTNRVQGLLADQKILASRVSELQKDLDRTKIPEDYSEKITLLRWAQEELQNTQKKLDLLGTASLGNETEHLRSGLLADQKILASRISELQKDLDRTKIPEDYSEKSTLLRRAQEELQSTQKKLDQLLADEIERLRLQKRGECITSFVELVRSNAVSSTRTGSRGDFQVSARVSFILAGAIRATTGEAPCWLVKVDPQQKSIRLSNSNLAAKDDSNELWMITHQP